MEKNDLFLLDGLLTGEKERCWRQTDARVQTVKKGESVFARIGTEPALGWLLDGTAQEWQGGVRLSVPDAGDLFGVAALYGDGKTVPVRAVAVTECRVLLLSQKTVSNWMALYPRIADNYVRFLSDRIRFLQGYLFTLTGEQTEEKLWRYLTAFRDRQGVVRLPERMSQLAQTLHMGRSSLYRSLDQLESAGVICRRDGVIVLLKEWAGE